MGVLNSSLTSCAPKSSFATVMEVRESTEVVVAYKDLFAREALYVLAWLNSTDDTFVGVGGIVGVVLDIARVGLCWEVGIWMMGISSFEGVGMRWRVENFPEMWRYRDSKAFL